MSMISQYQYVHCWLNIRLTSINTWSLAQNGWLFAHDILKSIFLNEIIVYWLNFNEVCINKKSSLVKSTGTKPLPDQMLTQTFDAIWHHYATISKENYIYYNCHNELRHVNTITPYNWLRYSSASSLHIFIIFHKVMSCSAAMQQTAQTMTPWHANIADRQHKIHHLKMGHKLDPCTVKCRYNAV